MKNAKFYEQDGVELKYIAKVNQYYVSDFGPMLKMKHEKDGEYRIIDPSIVKFFPIDL